jgi:arsenate reductase
MSLTIYHNPKCSKSRKTLALIEQSGKDHAIVEYLATPPDADTLVRLAKLTGKPLTDLLRRNEPDFEAAEASLRGVDERVLAEWMHRHPSVIERPIVVDEAHDRAVVGRPPENVLELLAP